MEWLKSSFPLLMQIGFPFVRSGSGSSCKKRVEISNLYRASGPERLDGVTGFLNGNGWACTDNGFLYGKCGLFGVFEKPDRVAR
ncbi:hypothetical protein CEXT_511911 [Caerostris extrusa]|uniref:Uncharacterized protein n=1 Tax=Caerostris extrusa TaxID=172846 RepID=A0AAV4NQI7_CAEEX|nr:hypothetical protein CEXT_511911 [Caerostris extrusa]